MDLDHYKIVNEKMASQVRDMHVSKSPAITTSYYAVTLQE